MSSKIKDIIINLGEKLLDEIFPENYTCNNCSKEINNSNKYNLCEDCASKIIPIKYPCKICGDELNSFTEICDNCKNRKRYFDYVTSVTTFDDVAKNLVYKLKYSGCKYIAKTIASYLAEEFMHGKFDLIDLVVCVPISQEKFKIRGYNQAEEILKEFVKKYNFDYNLSCLKRVKNTSTQTALTRSERRKNLFDAFEVANPMLVSNKNILVIDDVITTGSTLDAVAKVLKENGANKVYGLTFCHTKLLKETDSKNKTSNN